MTTMRRRVTFNEDVLVWNHEVTPGDNPACSIGTPVSLDWRRRDADPVRYALEQIQTEQELRYATARQERERKRQKHEPTFQGPPCRKLNYYERQDLLLRAGYTKEQLKASERGCQKDRRRRAWSMRTTLPVRIGERIQHNWHKLITGHGSLRYKRRVVQQWYQHYHAPTTA